jgi:hypothetical protein
LVNGLLEQLQWLLDAPTHNLTSLAMTQLVISKVRLETLKSSFGLQPLPVDSDSK